MSQLSDDFMSKWEHIINDVEMSSVPVECIERLVIRMAGRKRRTLNIQALRKQGLTSVEIEEVINRQLSDYGDSVRRVEFLIDLEVVADIVQPATDTLLNKL